jgi:hypothetical protein
MEQAVQLLLCACRLVFQHTLAIQSLTKPALCRGPLRQIWPQQAAAAGPRQKASKKVDGAQQLPLAGNALVPLSAEEEEALQHSDPQGDVLLTTRTLWLVRC